MPIRISITPIRISRQSEKNPSLHRYTAGGTIGLPIKKDKLFFFGSYQYTHASDEEIGISRAFVPADFGQALTTTPPLRHYTRPRLFGVEPAIGGMPGERCNERYHIRLTS